MARKRRTISGQRVATLSFVATIVLQLIVLTMFASEPGDPPGGGIAMDLWVDARRELVYAFLALIILGPALAVVFLVMNHEDTGEGRRTKARIRRVRAQRIRVGVYAMLWIAFAFGMMMLAPKKFEAVANVSWRYVIEPKMANGE